MNIKNNSENKQMSGREEEKRQPGPEMRKSEVGVEDDCNQQLVYNLAHLVVLLLWLAWRCHRPSHIHPAIWVFRLFLGWFENLCKTRLELLSIFTVIETHLERTQ
jgi:hypothetical protein